MVFSVGKQRNIYRWLLCLTIIVIVAGCILDKKGSAPSVEPMQVTIHFETTSTNGRYSPRNVHAVWVESADGTFIKTLGLWGGRKRAKNLTEWKTGAVDIESEIAARTGATQKAYGAYQSQWDMKDAAGVEVLNGDYVIRFELTSDNANKNNYHRVSVPFTKNGTPSTTEPVSEGGYQNIVLDYQAATATE